MPTTSQPKRLRNKLNNLDSKTWLKFQKSWFIHNPPPRRKDVLTHPAKFPETLAQEFIEFFTKKGQTVLDPMLGTGSALVAALRDYDGTLVFVSHDREFVSSLATRIVEIKLDGTVIDYQGNYEEYLASQGVN